VHRIRYKHLTGQLLLIPHIGPLRFPIGCSFNPVAAQSQWLSAFRATHEDVVGGEEAVDAVGAQFVISKADDLAVLGEGVQADGADRVIHATGYGRYINYSFNLWKSGVIGRIAMGKRGREETMILI
jgi:hypothetical protein